MRWLPIALVITACSGGTTPSPEATGTTGDTATPITSTDPTCDQPLVCDGPCPTWDATLTQAYGYASIAVDCADGGHALLQDNLFGTHAYFDAAGQLIARQHFSDVLEFCFEQQANYWEGDPVACKAICAYGGAPASAYPLAGELPDCL